MGGDAVCFHLEPDEPFVGETELQLGWFGDDPEVGAKFFQHRGGTEARDLLICDRRHDQVAFQAQAGRLSSRDHDRRQARLHVVRATAVHATLAHHGRERRGHPARAHGVHVRVQHEAAPAATAAQESHHARAPGHRLDDLDQETFGT